MLKFGLDWLRLSRVIVSTDKKEKKKKDTKSQTRLKTMNGKILFRAVKGNKCINMKEKTKRN